MNIKVLGLLGAFLFAAPVAAVAGPASGLTAHTYTDLATAPAAASDAAVAPGDTAKIEKVWWHGRGFGWRYGFRGYGWRYGFHPYAFRHYGFRHYAYRRYAFRPYYGFYGHRYFHRRLWIF